MSSHHVSYEKDKLCIVDGSYSSIVGHGDIPVTSLLLFFVIHVPNVTLTCYPLAISPRVLTTVLFSSLHIVCFRI